MAVLCSCHYVTDKDVGDHLDKQPALPATKAEVSQAYRDIHAGHKQCSSCPRKSLIGSIKRQTIEKGGKIVDLNASEYFEIPA